MINIQSAQFETQRALRVDTPGRTTRKPRPTRHDTMDAVREFAKRGRIFTLQEVKDQHPELNMSLLFEVSNDLKHRGELQRLSKGIFIPAGCTAPAEQEVKAATAEAEQSDLQADPILQHISTPRHTTELMQELGVTRGTIIRRLERLEANGLAAHRSIGRGTYIGRSEADLDRKEAELRACPHPSFRRILQLLPDTGAVMRLSLLERPDVGPTRGARQLGVLEDRGLVEVFAFSEIPYVALTDAGRKHACRIEGVKSRLPATDWHSEKYAKRMGVLMVVDSLGTATLNEVRAAINVLPECFRSAKPAHVAKQMIKEGLLAGLDAEPDRILGRRRVAIAPHGAEVVSRLRRIETFPERENLQIAIDEYQKSKPTRCRPERRLSRAQRAALAVLRDADTALTSKSIGTRLSGDLRYAHIGGAMGGLEKRGLIKRVRKVRSGIVWKITEAGRATTQALK